MTKRLLRLLWGGLFVVLALAAALLVMLLLLPEARLRNGADIDSVRFTGTITTPQSDAPLEMNEQSLISVKAAPHVRVRGHFERALTQGTVLMLRIRDARVVMLLNGAEVLSFGQPGSYPSIARSPGDVWYSFASPGITPEDEIEFYIAHAYPHTSVNAYEALFTSMFTGAPGAFLQQQVRENRLSIIFGLLTSSFGILVLAVAIVALCFRMPYVRQMLLFSGATLCAGLWMLFDFDYISLLLPYPVFNTTVAFLGLYMIPLFLLLFFRTFLTDWRKKAVTIAGAAVMALLAVGIVLQMCGAADLVELQIAAMALLLLALALINALLIAERRKAADRQRVHLAFLSVLPLFVGVLGDALNYLFGDYHATVGLHISFLFFAVMQVGILMKALQENAKRSVQLEHDLLQSRVALTLSQIKPHFLYNSLTAIKQLCVTNPQEAEEAVGYFANYLRSNLDSIASNTLIPLSREIAHTNCYLKLEQMRFGDRVRVQYDLRYQAFSLPSLTMQPLVENAVRYGITKKRDGGTIVIYADETETEYIVRVSDDGAGFDPAKQSTDDRSHIGLDNVRSRIAAMCEGTLKVESAPGQGTVATIRIPKRDATGEE